MPSRTAVNGSCSKYQARTWCTVASSASGRCAASTSPALRLQPGRSLLRQSHREPGQRAAAASRCSQPRRAVPPRRRGESPAWNSGPARLARPAAGPAASSPQGAAPPDLPAPATASAASSVMGREHRELTKHLPLLLGQQLIAPLHCRRQRPVPGHRPPVSTCQQGKPVIQPVSELGHPECLHPGRGQLDRQRHPIQSAHHARHRQHRLRGQREVRVNPAGPVSERGDRLTAADPGQGRPGSVNGASRYPGLPGHPRQHTSTGWSPGVRISSAASSNATHSSATAASTCSQLSKTISSCLRASSATSDSDIDMPGA